jgi:hypothetical protein
MSPRTRRTCIMGLAVMVLSAHLTTAAQEQPPQGTRPEPASYYRGGAIVEIRRGGTVLTRLELTKDVLFSVSDGRYRTAAEVAGSQRGVFEGDVEVRIRPAADIDPAESQRAQDLLAKGPVVLRATDVDVRVFHPRP